MASKTIIKEPLTYRIVRNTLIGIVDIFKALINKKIWGLLGLLVVFFCSLASYKVIIYLNLIPVIVDKRFYPIIFYTIILLPTLVYLNIYYNLKHCDSNKYTRNFMEINFNWNSKYPVLLKEFREGKTIILTFFSYIPLSKWESCKELLETGLKKTITKIYCGGNAQIVNLRCLDSQLTLPNKIYWNNDYMNDDDILTVGVDLEGDPVTIDLDKTHSILSSGATGGGKTVLSNLLAYQCLKKGYELDVIDRKRGVDYKPLGDSIKVIIDDEGTEKFLKDVVQEMETRGDILNKANVHKLKDYNKINDNGMKRKIIVIDEIAQVLNMKGYKGIELDRKKSIIKCVESISSIGRYVGISLFLFTQTPYQDVLNGAIKANLTKVICFRMPNGTASSVAIDSPEAAKLPEIAGRALIREGANLKQFQVYYFDDYMCKDLSNEDLFNETIEIQESKIDLRKADDEKKAIESKFDFNFSDF